MFKYLFSSFKEKIKTKPFQRKMQRGDKLIDGGKLK